MISGMAVANCYHLQTSMAWNKLSLAEEAIYSSGPHHDELCSWSALLHPVSEQYFTDNLTSNAKVFLPAPCSLRCARAQARGGTRLCGIVGGRQIRRISSQHDQHRRCMVT